MQLVKFSSTRVDPCLDCSAAGAGDGWLGETTSICVLTRTFDGQDKGGAVVGGCGSTELLNSWINIHWDKSSCKAITSANMALTGNCETTTRRQSSIVGWWSRVLKRILADRSPRRGREIRKPANKRKGETWWGNCDILARSSLRYLANHTK